MSAFNVKYSKVIKMVCIFLVVGVIYKYLFGFEPLNREMAVLFECILMIIPIYVCFKLHIIIHELGHLIFGLMTGYKFISFRVGKIILIKEKNKIVVRRRAKQRWILGQCLMEPPYFQDGNMPCLLYNLGGIIVTFSFTLISIVYFIYFSSSFILSFILCTFSIEGILLLIENAIPRKIKNRSNDASNIVNLIKNPRAKWGLYVQLKVCAFLNNGVSFSDMPSELFYISNDADLSDRYNANIKIYNAARHLENRNFIESKECYNEVLKANSLLTDSSKKSIKNSIELIESVIKYMDKKNKPVENHQPLFSIVIPAHNEEKYIQNCLTSIIIAAKPFEIDDIQIIVSANRCTDKTVEIAEQFGAIVVENDYRNIGAIRNAGARVATGKILITVDSDSYLSPNMLSEVAKNINSGKYIGGGTIPKFSRMSLGIFCSTIYVLILSLKTIIKNGFVSGSLFWCLREDFEAMGGFDEELVSCEDINFAVRLKKYGKLKSKKYGTIRKAHIITSSRKFDEFGDWYLIKNRKLTKRIFTGTDRQAADEFYYDFNDKIN